jgi:glutaminyl-peptide cyclotransferase
MARRVPLIGRAARGALVSALLLPALTFALWGCLGQAAEPAVAPVAAAPASEPAVPDRATAPSPLPARVVPERWKLEAVRTLPHRRDAFTQGLLWHGGKVYESTGQYGSSSLRRVELDTGTVEALREVPDGLFAEGLARVGERLIQLTWHAGLARVYDLATLAPVGEYTYEGEGWGLCFDGERLVMSDGSDRLVFRDPDSFAELSAVRVTLAGEPLVYLNELECVGGAVWANVWMEDLLVRIDPASGAVTAVVDASGLLSPAERRGADVLNGIAYRPETGTFLITGKWWPSLFEVRLAPATQENE